MTVLITGAAGFIGFSVSRVLLERGEKVVGIDNVNDYYDVSLKEARIGILEKAPGFELFRSDIADREAVEAMLTAHPDINRVVHLAAQAGVRYSMINPYAYVRSNLDGHLVLMEAVRNLKSLKHFVYASSSSVYGANTKLPFSVKDRVDHPISLYAATKKSMEMMSESYAHTFGLPLTGLRFFTAYGPWGRPDMAAFIFTRKIIADQPIPVFNNGDMRRDFTYIDDIVAGVIGCLDAPADPAGGEVTHRIYNIGNNRSENLMDFVSILEQALQRKARINLQPMQTGDVKETYADIDDTRRDFGFEPKTTIAEGIPRFVTWYKEFYGV